MTAVSLLSLLLLSAPDEAAERLRVAWASQYEWREDGIENATLDFAYRYRWESTQEDAAGSQYEGRAQVVVVGRAIARSHYPGAPAGRRRQFDSHVEWVLARFARPPFEDEFKEMRFEGPEPAGDGLERITVIGERRRQVYLLAGDRLAGLELPFRRRDGSKPNIQRYTTGDLGGGYAILGEEVTWDFGDRGKSATKRELTTAKGERWPYPLKYRCTMATPIGVSTIELEFRQPTVNAERPIVGDAAARDLLAAAWEHRYVLPRDLRLEADFQRRVDNDLDRAFWLQTLKGRVQIWGLDDIKFMLDEGVLFNREATNLPQQRLREHFTWLVWLLGEREFAREFKGCGFAFVADGEAADAKGARVVEVLGHERVLAFRVEDGRIAGYLENATEADRWWEFRLRKVKDDRVRIQSLTVNTGGKRRKLEIHWTRKGGIDVPAGFEAIGRGFRDNDESCGVATYRLKKLKVIRPK